MKPSKAAPKAGDLEREDSAAKFGPSAVSPDLARAAGLSLSDLLGVDHWRPPTIPASDRGRSPARSGTILNTPVSGLSIIRQAMERMTRGKFPSWGAAGNRRHRKDTLGEEDGLSMQHHAAVHAFIAGDDSALTLPEINEFLAHWCLTDKPITIRGPISFADEIQRLPCAPRSRRPLNAVRSRRLSGATRYGKGWLGRRPSIRAIHLSLRRALRDSRRRQDGREDRRRRRLIDQEGREWVGQANLIPRTGLSRRLSR